MNVINDDVQYITHSILDLRHLKGFAGWNEWELKKCGFENFGKENVGTKRHDTTR
ncbi:hypothetical protein DPMN_084486 [Dreissena polymorpha]|uniref:Uncharacterized protein n=1 Tax=Dreissena polymorpha TaxID=45954 RepID=A0A9D3YDW7_DREPO|nr:hypothetical protein DPMN_084486 [Dreissena polymorpha]